MSDNRPTSPDPEIIKVRSRQGSFVFSLIVSLAVALFVALLFGAVEITIHEIVNSNNKTVVAQRNYSRGLSCAILNGESEANGNTLANDIPGLSPRQKVEVRRQYELRVTESIEKNLGFTGRQLVNADGSLNCAEYIRLGSVSDPTNTSGVNPTTKP